MTSISATDKHPSSSQYRRDIDGLRAMAVLPVVAFHSGIHALRGGFVGVDVFFVISGFLITQQMFAEIVGGRFSITSFYERRIRRILPALVAMLAVTFALGMMYCLPSEMVDLSKSLVAAALSFSNVYFYFDSGYFDAPALAKPLLHTWSLAVEEQFYLVWPLFLILANRHLRGRVLILTIGVGLASFALSVIGAVQFPSATFYLPFTRLWELAAGGVLAIGLVKTPLGTTYRNILYTAGFALIVGSVFLIDSTLPFPGLLALPPCLGAALILLAGRDGSTVVGKLLAWRPVAFFGVISYSLYLWHWPIVVFQKNYTFLASGLSEPQNKLLIVAASCVMAVISWKFIEQPFRGGVRRPGRRLLFKLAGGGTVVLCLAGILAWSGGGFPSRYTPQELEFAKTLAFDADIPWRVGDCFLVHTKSDERFTSECLSLSDTKANYLVIGDSHAAQIWFGLNTIATDKHFLQATSSDCFPTVEHRFGELRSCTTVLDEVFQSFLPAHPLSGVFLIARWNNNELAEVAKTIDWLAAKNIRVTLIGPSPVFDTPVPRLMIAALRRGDPALPQRHLDPAMNALDAAMARLAAEHGIPYVSMITLMCPKNTCTIAGDDSLPLIFDREHLTADGSKRLARQLIEFNGIW